MIRIMCKHGITVDRKLQGARHVHVTLFELGATLEWCKRRRMEAKLKLMYCILLLLLAFNAS